MTRVLRIAAVLGVLACGGCGGTGGGDAAPDDAAVVIAEATLGPVAATVRMAPAEPRFGDRVRFELAVDAGAGVELEAPEFGARLGHFRIRDREDRSQVDEGRIRAVVVAEAERTGTNIVRWPAVRFRVVEGEAAGSDQELAIAPFEVEVAGLTPDQEPALRDLGAPLPPVALPTDGLGAGWYAAGAVVLLGLAGGLLWWRRRRAGAGAGGVAPPVPPEVEARRALERLLRSGLAEQGRFAEFYVELTGIVRRYVERTTGVHAPEQTTEEFLREMERHPEFDAARRRELGGFLAASDLVKYAAQVPTGDEIHGAVAAARAFCGLGAADGEVAA